LRLDGGKQKAARRALDAHRRGRPLLALELRDDENSDDHQPGADHSAWAERMLLNTEQPKMVDDKRHKTVMVRPAKAPAPTLSTNRSPAMTAKAPMTPPRGAHHGIAPIPSTVGKGRGRQKHRTPSKAITGKKETRLASHGFVSECLKAPFIGGPQA
jgi:hypothetical protein